MTMALEASMRSSPLHYFPLALLISPTLLTHFSYSSYSFVFLIALIQIGILEYAYEKIGIRRRYVFGVLFLSLLGNFPLQSFLREIVSGNEVFYFGMRYVILTVQDWPRTVIAMNLGGAVVPTLLSFYLTVEKKLYFRGILPVALVAVVVHWMAQPIEGLGIAVPIFVPPFVAAGSALLLSRQSRPSLGLYLRESRDFDRR
jgi:uncharacterized membrane protein